MEHSRRTDPVERLGTGRGGRVRAAGTARRVVVVDNDPAALELACTDLRLEGHDVVGSGPDGEAALRLVAETDPDVLVVDHRMPPGPFGLEVARRISRDHPEVRVIVYSNYRDAELVRATRAAGAVFLPKGNLRRLRRAVVDA